jgi:hypothetical protein
VSGRDMTPEEAAVASTRWVRELMRRCKIEVVTFRDGTTGLLNVPAKYVAAIDVLHQALAAAMAGEGLPEFAEEEQPKKRKPAPSRGGGG